jgi:protein-tyrosine phosphatase
MWREFDAVTPLDGACLRDLDIADPWYGGHADFVATLAALEAGREGLLAHLRELARRA